MSHAKLSPSSAHRWLNCPASVRASEGIKDKGSSAALEGSIAHELGDTVLKGDKRSASDYVGSKLEAYPDHKITKEMADYVQEYVDYVRNLGGSQFYEVNVDYSDYVKDGDGTSDAIVMVGRKMYVIDLKYGKGLQVFAEKNEQAQLYALGALNDFDFGFIDEVICVIVQPRLDHIDEWVTTPEALRKFGEYCSQQAELTESPDAPFCAGEKQCKFCPAKPTCAELKRVTETTILSHFDALDIKPLQTLGDDQLRRVLENKKLVISWLEAVETMVTERLRAGQSFDGFKLVAGRSLRKWADQGHAELLLIKLLEDKAYNKNLLSVAQAEKVLGKSKQRLLDKFIVKPEGKPTLVHESDKRQAVNISVDDFDDLT
jgi:hypothetical protein